MIMRHNSRGAATTALVLMAALLGPTAVRAEDAPPAANSVDLDTLEVPRNNTAWIKSTYLSALKSPLPQRIFGLGAVPPIIPQYSESDNKHGKLGAYHPSGPTPTRTNAFFQPLGTNGRSCVTCHQPPDGMSVSAKGIKKRFDKTRGRDPIFAPVDGANCPDLVPESLTSGALIGGLRGKGKKAFKKAYSLLLDKGLIRIFLPEPTPLPGVDNPIVDWEVVHDPYGCNANDSPYAHDGDGNRLFSMHRRPLITANLKFKHKVGQQIMWDGREPDLESQAIHATMGHAQATEAQVEKAAAAGKFKEIVAFELDFFSAQAKDKRAKRLDDAGAKGGPVYLAEHEPAPAAPGGTVFDEYDNWASQPEARRSIERGERLFQGRGTSVDYSGAPNPSGRFLISKVAGLNDVVLPSGPIGDIANGSCAGCHAMPHAGNDVFPGNKPAPGGIFDIGVGGQASGFGGPAPSKDLSIFKLTCKAPHKFYGTAVLYTNDPGRAMHTGKCEDIGTSTAPQMRALHHEPYFRDGSAETLEDVVAFYDRRFKIGYTKEQMRDLVGFLNAL